ncbi:hypothetical protein RUMCAL_01553 [Ruminococcus callidus ATCC 27760]|uniref:Uncharacterized protein n=1 Tax=Ruminococcus callidus ATCC 27760 TaxID=411473 RepID=U2KUY3_9FIRM|nr:hypothetical protein RUMCAL_01553 [Ruminococcus callidus ATCC 27760]
MQLHLFSAISVRIHIRFSQFCSYSMPANRVEYSVENTCFLTACILITTTNGVPYFLCNSTKSTENRHFLCIFP